MTTPDVPYRFEHSFEVPGTPEQVWAAIATANGISSWMLATDLEEREGGAVVFHMGPDSGSTGEVTAFDAPRRFAYEEPDWAVLAGHPEAAVTPMATEFVVEAASGGTCVVRVVSSAFGTGADWEEEFWSDAFGGWTPMFDTLRLYLTHFPGQQVTTMEAATTRPASVDAVWAAMRSEVSADVVGKPVTVRGASGTLERLGDHELLVRLEAPVEGLLALIAHGSQEESWVMAKGHFFSAGATDYVAQEEPRWQAWLESLGR